MIVVTHLIRIPLAELEFSYARSSGPGGQNVNKVSSKAILRWNLERSPSLPEETRARLRAKLATRLTREGELVIASDRFRDQLKNREDCIQKLQMLLREASHVPKARKKTKPSRSTVKKAKESKRRHSEKKRLRRSADRY